MRKRVLKVQTFIGPIPTTKVSVWCDAFGPLAGHYVPRFAQPIVKVEAIPGRIKTCESFLKRFNKNNVTHESYSGEIPLLMRNFSSSSAAGSLVASRLRERGCQFDLASYYPTIDKPFTVLSTRRGLCGYFPFDTFNGRERVQVAAIVFDIKSGTMYGFNAAGIYLDKIENYVAKWDSGRIGHPFYNRYQTVRLSKGVDQRDATKIAKSLPYLTDGVFPTYEPSLDAALGDAVSNADGFHFSRLAAEIAVDGLAVQSLAEIIRLMKKTPAKYVGPLKKLLAVAKVLPSAYLGLQYGVLAPLRDYAKLPGALESQFQSIPTNLVGTSKSSYEDFEVNTRVSLSVQQPSDTQRLFELTYLLKGGFSLDDLWEVVPLSFVVDWFVNLGNLAESFRFNEIYSKLIVNHATVSRSYERIVEYDIDGMVVPLKHRIYTRRYCEAGSLPTHIFSFQWKDIKGSWRASNADEAASMILTYLL